MIGNQDTHKCRFCGRLFAGLGIIKAGKMNWVKGTNDAERLAAVVKMANRVTDECRDPLTIIGGFSRRLHEKTPEDDPHKKNFRRLGEQVIILEERVSQIIGFEKEA
jgi:signal transduction histidine kinase